MNVYNNGDGTAPTVASPESVGSQCFPQRIASEPRIGSASVLQAYWPGNSTRAELAGRVEIQQVASHIILNVCVQLCGLREVASANYIVTYIVDSMIQFWYGVRRWSGRHRLGESSCLLDRL